MQLCWGISETFGELFACIEGVSNNNGNPGSTLIVEVDKEEYGPEEYLARWECMGCNTQLCSSGVSAKVWHGFAFDKLHCPLHVVSTDYMMQDGHNGCLLAHHGSGRSKMRNMCSSCILRRCCAQKGGCSEAKGKGP